jgi:hypothetical protein
MVISYWWYWRRTEARGFGSWVRAWVQYASHYIAAILERVFIDSKAAKTNPPAWLLTEELRVRVVPPAVQPVERPAKSRVYGCRSRETALTAVACRVADSQGCIVGHEHPAWRKP